MTGKPLHTLKVLIIIPGTVSYFYDEEGRRVAQALRGVGAEVDIRTLSEIDESTRYDWCFLMNLSEINVAYKNPSGMFSKLVMLKLSCRHIAMILLECVEMKWFRHSLDLLHKADIPLLIDLGFHNQYHRVSNDTKENYHFVLNGLTTFEKSHAGKMQTPLSDRPIPWTFVGHLTHQRLDFIENLMCNLSRDGYLYLVHFTPVTETGPHLNQAQFHRVLTQTRLKIWCSHHPYFYVESIRFRMALMSGSLPIKVNLRIQQNRDETYPFDNLVFDEHTFYDDILQLDFEQIRKQFVSEFLAMPTLDSAMLNLIQTLDGVPI